ncbi:hypothetical protein [Escherichia coli]|uniref:F4 family fimbrial subunit n=1 Tax=Escherichia coli TaxID=562 RepID=UPI002B2D9327|nr:hypothetical protein VEE75_43420 [Escherichia coli]
MKKTLVALAVAASAVLSGSAAAGWDIGGKGGTVNFGGTLGHEETVDSPWSVYVGDGVSDLNDMQSSDSGKTFMQSVSKPVPVLGLKHAPGAYTFKGGVGLSPQINYGGAIDTSRVNKGQFALELDVKNGEGHNVGKMYSVLFASAEAVSVEDGYIGPDKQHIGLYAERAGQGFFGGLPTEAGQAKNDQASVESLFPGMLDGFWGQGEVPKAMGSTDFADSSLLYSAYYAAGIKSGESISVVLDNPIRSGEQLKWTASMPITVSYQ